MRLQAIFAGVLTLAMGAPVGPAVTPDACGWQTSAAALARSVEGSTDPRAVAIRERLRALGITASGAQPCASAPSDASTGSAAKVPGDLIDLSDWYLTLPTGAKGKPENVYQPDLAGFSNEYFQLDDQRDGVVFTSNAGGVTTENSTYPRSELREMSGPTEDDKASWSNTSGTHTLALRQAVTALPTAKPHVVTAQIHDGSDDVVEVRLEGERLMAQYADGKSDVTLDEAYRLGTPFDLKIVASGGKVEILYNDAPAVELPLSGSGWYFKTGSYLQSNTEKGDAADAVGTVVLYALKLTHTD